MGGYYVMLSQQSPERYRSALVKQYAHLRWS